ncbi:hypothetical protein [Afifella marina]|uniref:Uncharacterized protein n=1 Tax=Afifella marina DSM 2698 TaxID=1120955 RepID=A0A1G5M782_AFIMA|nr:hypothetical protein [Afifella marina]MBK1622945.1 hypothetical protein [Afifella marina DSM 2698]MBK1625939.1 hypothetical protein [Afifella marina]MBK5917763.1 hypothetical protein [Afifella marina]RAI23677.1 hypothetical protein CH311_02050 [Afifella marina DSM 2698]SCZ20408.1 hypothetical protein SAMN03080610_00138 [Afifella marina DSM 2698]
MNAETQPAIDLSREAATGGFEWLAVAAIVLLALVFLKKKLFRRRPACVDCVGRGSCKEACFAPLAMPEADAGRNGDEKSAHERAG